MCTAYSLAEICSAYPSAGSVYHWAGMIPTKKYKPILSYICGWANFLGNAAGDCVFAYAFTGFLKAGISLAGGETLSTGSSVGISLVMLSISTVINFLNISHIGMINNVAAFVQIITLLIILIGMPITSKIRNSDTFIFTDYYNSTGWSSASYVVSIGLLASMFSFSGYEASAHLAEETKGSRKAASYGIINTCYATGIAGFSYLLILLFLTGNITTVLNGPTDEPVVNVFLNSGHAFGSFLVWLITINLFLAEISSVTITGRITFALLRDGALPGAEYWAEVDETTKSPHRYHSFLYIDC